MIYPKNINNNDLWGVTATSSGISSEFDMKKLELAKNNLEKLGYRFIRTNNVLTNYKFTSSTGLERAKQFMELWENKEVKVISQVRGGEFLMEMLPFLDIEKLKMCEPKWVTGYSDSSLLNFYLTTNLDIATLTGPNIMHYATNPLHESLKKQLELLQNDKVIENSFDLYERVYQKERINYILSDNVRYKSLYEDKKIEFTGRIIGGCVEAISTIIGTKFDNTINFINKYKEGMIWYLDIFDSNPLDLYRLLFQMKEANWFFNCKGIIIGRTRAIKEIEDFSILETFHRIFDDLKIPVIYDVDLGHVMPSFSLINGNLGTFSYNHGKGNLLQEKI